LSCVADDELERCDTALLLGAVPVQDSDPCVQRISAGRDGYRERRGRVRVREGITGNNLAGWKVDLTSRMPLDDVFGSFIAIARPIS
jgi:hypothetical protein